VRRAGPRDVLVLPDSDGHGVPYPYGGGYRYADRNSDRYADADAYSRRASASQKGMSEGIVHTAGFPLGGVQKCEACGYVLSEEPFMCWAEGPVTVWDGNPRHMSAGTHSETICCERGN
jgi:hypothetical protein